MNRYEITLADGYGREIDRLEVRATNLRLALAQSEAILCGRASGHGQAAVSASVELLGEYASEIERVACARCGHEQSLAADWRTAYPLTICSRCGRELAESQAIYDYDRAQEAADRLRGAEIGSCGPREAFSCEVDESAGLREITTRPDVARAERLAAELRREMEWRAAVDEGRWPPTSDETLHGLGDFDGGEEL